MKKSFRRTVLLNINTNTMICQNLFLKQEYPFKWMSVQQEFYCWSVVTPFSVTQCAVNVEKNCFQIEILMKCLPVGAAASVLYYCKKNFCRFGEWVSVNCDH